MYCIQKSASARFKDSSLLREHRLYQADWLLRFYGFSADELLDERNPDFDPKLDPKTNWAINNMSSFLLK